MEKINDGGPALPIPGGGVICTGISIRDYFAAKAMASLITTAGAPCLNGLDGYEQYTASASYKMADAMLKAREVQS